MENIITFTSEELECLKWLIAQYETMDALDFIGAVEHDDGETIGEWMDSYRYYGC